jgi:predicted nucleic acid-binding protein
VIVADTSVVVAGLLPWHEGHEPCRAALRDAEALVAHVGLEAYSVMTRLPEPVRVDPATAAAMLSEHFPAKPVAYPAKRLTTLLAEFPRLGITGGATYDAIVGATAREAEATLLTRDRRALPTYSALGVRLTLL